MCVYQAKRGGIDSHMMIIDERWVINWQGTARPREMAPLAKHSHPATSPYLNIECYWQVVKTPLSSMERHNTQLDGLRENVQRGEIPQSTIDDGFIMKIKDRRKLVLEACGKQIRG